MIDDIKLNPDVLEGVSYSIHKNRVCRLRPPPPPGIPTHIPFSLNKSLALNYLPFLVKSNEERQIAIEFTILSSDESYYRLLCLIRQAQKVRAYWLRSELMANTAHTLCAWDPTVDKM